MLPIRLALPALLLLALALPTAAACPPAVLGPLAEDACGSPPPPGPVGDACVFAGGAGALEEDVHDLAHEWLDALP